MNLRVLPYIQGKPRRSLHDFDIRPSFPPVEDLIEKAEKMTDSCFLKEQVDVGSKFIKEVALRGVYNKKYSLDELRKVSILVDHMARRKMRQLYNLGAN
jgi:hypothetical protein